METDNKFITRRAFLKRCATVATGATIASLAGGVLYDQDSNGYYWSATQYDSNDVYSLRFSSTNSSTNNRNTKTNGFPLRCVK